MADLPGRLALRPKAGSLLAWAMEGLIAVCALAAAPAQALPHWPSLAELAEVVDISALAASPDGRLVAFRVDRPSVDRNSYDLVWHVVETGTGTVRVIGGAGEPIIVHPGLVIAEPPIWSPDGHWLYYRALRDGEVQLWRSAVDGSATERVTSEPGDVMSLARAPDGRGLHYEVGPSREEIARAELQEYREGVLVDGHVDLSQNVFRGGIIHGRRATERLTGRWFERAGILWKRPLLRRSLDLATLKLSDLPPRSGTEDAAPVARSAAGDEASAGWDGSAGRLTVKRADGATLSCDAAACRRDRIAWLKWQPERDAIVFASASPARVQTLRLWDLGSGRVRPVAASDGLLSGGRDEDRPCAVTSAVAICVAAAPASPPRLERIDLATGARAPLFDPNRLLRERRWPEVERLEWQSETKQRFTAVLFLPPRNMERPAPLFISYYLCEGFIRGGVGDEWPFAALAARGVASACITATPRRDSDDAVDRYRSALGGIRALVTMLDRRGLIDPKRVGMGGLSFGSEVTMWAVLHSDLIAAASVASPQFEPANYWFNHIRGRDHPDVMRRVWGLGKPEETPERWRLLSPALNADRIDIPLLLQLPELEARYAVELYARLSRSTTPAELYVFPDERHIKTQPRHRLAVYRRNVDWFRFWLQGHVDPDPAKAAQYQRWQALAQRAGSGLQRRQERSQISSAARSNSRK